MTRSFAQLIQATCPRCSQPVQIETWLIVDLTERPDLAERIHEGTLHAARCPHCGHAGQVNAPLLIFNPPAVEAESVVEAGPVVGAGLAPAQLAPAQESGGKGRPCLIFSPAQRTTADQDHENPAGLLDHLRDSLGDAWQDEWQKNLVIISRNLLPNILTGGGDPETALQAMLAQAHQDIERQREQDPEGFAKKQRELQEMIEATIGIRGEGHLAGLLIAWIRTPDWDASEAYLQEHAAELLTDQAEAELECLWQGNPDAQEIPPHQTLLRRAREADIETAYREFHAARQAIQHQQVEEPQTQLSPTSVAVTRFVLADDKEADALLQSEAALLLTRDASYLLRSVVEISQENGDEALIPRLTARLAQLQAARQAVDPAAATERDLIDLLIAWIEQDTLDDAQAYLQEHAADLLTDQAEADLEYLRQINPDAQEIPQYQTLLRRARETDIETAYREFHAAR